jgi:hypothetical protein
MQRNTRDISCIKQRILQFAAFEGISKYEIYHKTGISNGVFSQKGGISEDNILKFISYYENISEQWLLTGNGPMKRDSIDKCTINEPELGSYAIDSLIKRIESLSIENFSLMKEISELKMKREYDEPDRMSIASES